MISNQAQVVIALISVYGLTIYGCYRAIKCGISSWYDRKKRDEIFAYEQKLKLDNAYKKAEYNLYRSLNLIIQSLEKE